MLRTDFAVPSTVSQAAAAVKIIAQTLARSAVTAEIVATAKTVVLY